ncbi:MAG: reverse transcriptase domain-containing protein, partial [Cyanobacteria bacterium J06614_10]
KIAKFLLPVISPFTKNEYTIENSKSFVEELRNLEINNSMIMASFDVESLFTNVPLKETTNIILEKYHPDKLFGIGKNILKKLLEFATSQSIFIFNGNLYNQVDGISMGSSLGPVYANTFMCFKEVEWLENCPLDFKPLFYRRYVDDTFLMFKEYADVAKFLEYLNGKHPNIRFTCEIENNGKLPFLDILICKNNGNISTSVYRKPTFTGLGLSWFSFCPDIYKVNSIKTLLNRAYNISSNYLVLHEEIEKLRSYFINNHYKSETFFKIVREFLSAKFSIITTHHSVPKLVKYVKLPFYGKVSFTLRKNLNEILRNEFPAIDFRFIFTNNFTIGSFFSIKDK